MTYLPLIPSRDEVITHNIHFLGEEEVDAEVEVHHGDTPLFLLSRKFLRIHNFLQDMIHISTISKTVRIYI